MSNKPTKIIIASTLGAALLLGGGTYALWTSSVTPTTNATIQTGTADLTANDAGAWIDRGQSDLNPTDPPVSIDIAAFRSAPGDVVEYNQGYTIKTASGNDTTFSVTFDNDTETGVAALRARGITVSTSIVDSTGAVVATSPAAGDTLSTSYTVTGATPAAGTVLTVRFDFNFASTVTADDTKNLEVLISDAVVSADQVV